MDGDKLPFSLSLGDILPVLEGVGDDQGSGGRLSSNATGCRVSVDTLVNANPLGGGPGGNGGVLGMA